MKYSLDDIRTFLTVVEHGSISAAAQRLELTKSVVSQRVAHLETALGVALLHRSSRGVRATDRGRLFQAQACDAIALLYLDAPFPEDVLAKVRAHRSIDSAKRLQFDVNGL